jgi:PAS domain S-box-containing protein
VLDREQALLMWHPHRHFDIPAELQPPIEEVLLIPFHVAEEAAGTLWVVSHEEARTFDAEDLRLMRSLSRFASTACQFLAAREAKVDVGRRLERQSEELQRLSEIPAVALFRCDRELRLRSANGTYARLLGRDPDDIVGHKLDEVLGADGFEALRGAVERVLDGEAIDQEVEVPLPQGARYLRVNFIPDDGGTGRVAGWHASVSDLTDRRRSEEAAARSALQKEALYELADALQRARDASAIYTAALDAITRALRCRRASILLFEDTPSMRFVAWRGLSEQYVTAATGHSPWAADARRPDPLVIGDVDAAGLDPALRTAIQAESIASLAFIPLVIGDRLIGKFMAYSRVPDAFGKDDLELGLTIARQLAFAIDRQRAEEMLRKHAAELARVADSLRRNEEELQAVDRRKDEFLAMLAHELRNPLAPISTAVQILALARGQDSMQDQARAIIERQTARLTRLVDDLLEVSRINTGRIQLQLARIPLNEVVERAVETVASIVREPGHRLEITLPSSPLWVQADGARLEQVFVNLLNNAAKYTNPGGEIRLQVRQTDEGQAIVTVADNGIGIEPQLLPHVFELFTQAERALDRSRGGLGIGLSLVRRLVEKHGGTVAARSTVGVGSEFSVTLPLAPVSDALEQEAPGDAWPDLSSTQRLRVLVVDDNVDAADSLVLLLRASGHAVEQAHDGTRAIEVARHWEPDVVLLDIGLPEVSGYDVARAIKASRADTHLVALTGYGQQADRQRTAAAGFDDHLVKPATAHALQRIFETVGGHRPASD